MLIARMIRRVRIAFWYIVLLVMTGVNAVTGRSRKVIRRTTDVVWAWTGHGEYVAGARYDAARGNLPLEAILRPYTVGGEYR